MVCEPQTLKCEKLIYSSYIMCMLQHNLWVWLQWEWSYWCMLFSHACLLLPTQI